MSTLANSNQKKRRLEGKDFITIGIYTVIYMVITTLVAILGFIPIFIPEVSSFGFYRFQIQ